MRFEDLFNESVIISHTIKAEYAASVWSASVSTEHNKLCWINFKPLEIFRKSSFTRLYCCYVDNWWLALQRCVCMSFWREGGFYESLICMSVLGTDMANAYPLVEPLPRTYYLNTHDFSERKLFFFSIWRCTFNSNYFWLSVLTSNEYHERTFGPCNKKM